MESDTTECRDSSSEVKGRGLLLGFWLCKLSQEGERKRLCGKTHVNSFLLKGGRHDELNIFI
jgi:hypothetical protein